MAKRRDRDSGRFRWFESDRSGFQYGFQPLTSAPNKYGRWTGRPVTDNGLKVAPSEYDQPPPSKKSLGGEGDISGDPRANSDFGDSANYTVIPPESQNTVIYVNSSTSVQWNNDPAVLIAGSNVNQTMSVNPQIVAGNSGQQITFLCVGSSITFLNGSGLTLRQSPYVMSSGNILSVIYQNPWQEMSRGVLYGDLGQF